MDCPKPQNNRSGTATSCTQGQQGELLQAGSVTESYHAAGDVNRSGDTPAAGNEETTFVDPTSGDTLDGPPAKR